MQNPIPPASNKRFSLTENIADGLKTHETNLAIMYNTESVLRGELATARTADNAYQAAKAARITATRAQTDADRNGRKFIVKARDVLKPVLGTSWSQAWEQAGFLSRSLAAPPAIAGRMELLKRLQIHLAANPTQENAPLHVTSAVAGTLHTALSDAVSAVNASRGDQQAKKQARDAALAALSKRIRGVIKELSQLIGPNDGRWLEFGLKMPGAVELPGVVGGLEVQGAGAGHLFVRWNGSPRADRYRVRKQVIGTDNEFVDGATVTETNANLNTFPSGARVRVEVSAVNEAGESAPSQAVEALVP